MNTESIVSQLLALDPEQDLEAIVRLRCAQCGDPQAFDLTMIHEDQKIRELQTRSEEHLQDLKERFWITTQEDIQAHLENSAFLVLPKYRMMSERLRRVGESREQLLSWIEQFKVPDLLASQIRHGLIEGRFDIRILNRANLKWIDRIPADLRNMGFITWKDRLFKNYFGEIGTIFLDNAWLALVAFTVSMGIMMLFFLPNIYTSDARLDTSLVYSAGFSAGISLLILIRKLAV